MDILADINDCRSLEQGKILFFSNLGFTINDNELWIFNENIIKKRKKNISFNPIQKQLTGIFDLCSDEDRNILINLMNRFAIFAKDLILKIAPNYESSIIYGRTSYRPAEIAGRKTSIIKDDTRLHVDAFPSSPVQGKRILRVFTNINCNNIPRIWETGESFFDVATKFFPQVKPYRAFKAKIMEKIKFTKSLRTEYDHLMLGIHDCMKKDDIYQFQVQKQKILFPPQSTWIVFTDQVSHAALSGQFLLEQTFYLPYDSMQEPQYAPINQLNKIKQLGNYYAK